MGFLADFKRIPEGFSWGSRFRVSLVGSEYFVKVPWSGSHIVVLCCTPKPFQF